MFNKINKLSQKPKLYENGTSEYIEIWTDEHISKGMLEAHLNPDWDAATWNHNYVRNIVNWISHLAPADKYQALLDLGCGPGIYTELFYNEGYQVSGMDLSKRSIAYAQALADEKKLPITYYQQNYLTMNFLKMFDIITLIFYDFGVLSKENRMLLLKKIYTALKLNGLFIFDVNTPKHFSECEEAKSWEYNSNGGFFSPHSHLHLKSTYLYEDKRAKCDNHIIITENDIKSYNCWQHAFTRDEIEHDLKLAGFSIKGVYGNMTGTDYCEDGKEMCVVAEKKDSFYG